VAVPHFVEEVQVAGEDSPEPVLPLAQAVGSALVELVAVAGSFAGVAAQRLAARFP